MSYIFGNLVTAHGVAANNRGTTEGNMTTLQKLNWKGKRHTTVSAESIRWALRIHMQESGLLLNRTWNGDGYDFRDQSYADPKKYPDDELFGYMTTQKNSEANKRKGALEVTRAVSTHPWDPTHITFSSKGGKKESTSLYATEFHPTRYQFGFALNTRDLSEPSRVNPVIDAFSELKSVGGNHSRFKYDFSAELVCLRVTHDPAARIFFICDMIGKDEIFSLSRLVEIVESGDVEAKELIVGGVLGIDTEKKRLAALGVTLCHGTKEAFQLAKTRLMELE